MKRWYSPSDRLPEQGKKILCMNNGDFYVAQRFAELWLPIPFTDSVYCKDCEPELWQEIDFPKDYTGYMKVNINEKYTYTIDEFEEECPEDYNLFVENLRRQFRNSLR